MKQELLKIIEEFLEESEEIRTQRNNGAASIREATFTDFIIWLSSNRLS